MRGKPTFIYSNYPAPAAVTATDTAAGYAAADVLEGCEDSGWKPANTTGSKTLTIDQGASLPVGGVALLADYPNGVTLEIRGSSDNFTGDNVQLSAASVINSASFNTAYRLFTETGKRYLRLIFSGFGASFQVTHVALCRTVTLPYLEDGHDPDAFQPTGSHLVGVSGVYLGATQQCAMRNINLDFGIVTSANYTQFQLWAEACIETMRPFFYVPDIDQPECYFGWVEGKYKFSAPSKLSRHKLAPIPFISRIA